MSDAKLFTRVSIKNYLSSLLTDERKKGKAAELRQELSLDRKDKNNKNKKIALKKIVANMTMSNNEMIALLPDIVTCMSINDIDIKKM